jgi:hypothetical protein
MKAALIGTCVAAFGLHGSKLTPHRKFTKNVFRASANPLLQRGKTFRRELLEDLPRVPTKDINFDH